MKKFYENCSLAHPFAFPIVQSIGKIYYFTGQYYIEGNVWYWEITCDKKKAVHFRDIVSNIENESLDECWDTNIHLSRIDTCTSCECKFVIANEEGNLSSAEVELIKGELGSIFPKKMEVVFTFGSAELFPFKNGYIVIYCYDLQQAFAEFRNRYPDVHENTLNCSDYYFTPEVVKKIKSLYKDTDCFLTIDLTLMDYHFKTIYIDEENQTITYYFNIPLTLLKKYLPNFKEKRETDCETVISIEVPFSEKEAKNAFIQICPSWLHEGWYDINLPYEEIEKLIEIGENEISNSSISWECLTVQEKTLAIEQYLSIREYEEERGRYEITNDYPEPIDWQGVKSCRFFKNEEGIIEVLV